MISNSSLDATAAEILALAVTSVFPAAQLLTAAADGFGFYYDFYLEQNIDALLVPQIEEHMRGSIKGRCCLQSNEMMRENGAQLFVHRGQHIKAEIALQSLYNVIPVVSVGQFCDMPFAPCQEELPDTSIIKILSVSKRPFYLASCGEIVATRIYAALSCDKAAAKLSVKRFEAAKNCNHVRLGQQMSLFALQEPVGNLGVQWLPNGVAICCILQQLWQKELSQKDFKFTKAPRFVSALPRGKKNSPLPHSLPVFDLDGQPQVMVAAALQHHLSLFGKGNYRAENLPVRFAEWQDHLRDLPLQQLMGLFASRAFSADIAHIFCSFSEVVTELISSLQFIQKIITIIGIECQWMWACACPPDAASAAKTLPSTAFQAMQTALQACGIDCLPGKDLSDDETGWQGHAKVKVYFHDALGRQWAGPSLSVNFHLPVQQGLWYQKGDGCRQAPVLIKSSFCGSVERLVAALLEQHAGWLPLELAPEQFRVISVGDENRDYAQEVFAKLKQLGLRAKIDSCSSYAESKANRSQAVSLGAKIHAAESERVPYLLILGGQEKKEKLVSIRALAQESKVGSKGSLHSSKLPAKASLARNVSTVACSLECFLQRLQDEGHLTVDETCNLGVSNHVES